MVNQSSSILNSSICACVTNASQYHDSLPSLSLVRSAVTIESSNVSHSRTKSPTSEAVPSK